MEALARMLADAKGDDMTQEDRKLVDQAMDCSQSPGFSAEPAAQIQYDPDVTVSYGEWECRGCGSQFYGGGKALHKASCHEFDTGYKACTFLFGDEAIAKAGALLPAGVTRERMESCRAKSSKAPFYDPETGKRIRGG